MYKARSDLSSVVGHGDVDVLDVGAALSTVVGIVRVVGAVWIVRVPSALVGVVVLVPAGATCGTVRVLYRRTAGGSVGVLHGLTTSGAIRVVRVVGAVTVAVHGTVIVAIIALKRREQIWLTLRDLCSQLSRRYDQNHLINHIFKERNLG